MRNRHLYFTFAIVIMTLILQMPRIAQAQAPTISSGLNWLISTQSTDGSWDSTMAATDSVQATSAALESLVVLNSTNSLNYVNASNWLAAQQLDTTRYLSERLRILSAPGTDKDVIISYLNVLNRGWGGYDEYAANNLDTAFALQALKTTNYSDYSVLFGAVNFLTTNQNSDGGWGLESGDSSNVFVTATVLNALSLYNSVTFNVQSSIDKSVISALETKFGWWFRLKSFTVYDSGSTRRIEVRAEQPISQQLYPMAPDISPQISYRTAVGMKILIPRPLPCVRSRARGLILLFHQVIFPFQSPCRRKMSPSRLPLQ